MASNADVAADISRQIEGPVAAAEKRQWQTGQVQEHKPKSFAQAEQHWLGELTPAGQQQRAGGNRLAMYSDVWLEHPRIHELLF
jgi:hypothetical protein